MKKGMGMKMAEIFVENSLENNREYLTLSKAFVMFIKHEIISDPFLKKYPTVSFAPQVHIEGKKFFWYTNCKSSRPR